MMRIGLTSGEVIYGISDKYLPFKIEVFSDGRYHRHLVTRIPPGSTISYSTARHIMGELPDWKRFYIGLTRDNNSRRVEILLPNYVRVLRAKHVPEHIKKTLEHEDRIVPLSEVEGMK